jgi:Integrase zinc binding domain/Integrase core domain
MDSELYYGLRKYLATHQLPNNVDENIQREILKTAQRYQLTDDLLYDKQHGKMRIVIPHSKFEMTMKLAHDHPLSGHTGINSTYQRMRLRYSWPKMYDDVRRYVRSCEICQKRAKNKETERMTPIEVSPEPFDHVGIDVIGPLPRTIRGNRYIVVAIDYLTKWPEARAIQLADALTIAPFIYEDIICRHGIPNQLTSDRGTEFVNELISKLCRAYQIQHITTTAYHPQANGLVERMNQTIKNILSKLTENTEDWDLYLNSALFAIRTSRQESIRRAPEEVVYGRKMRTPQDREKSKESERINDIDAEIARLHKVRQETADYIKRAQERQKRNQEKEYKEPTQLTIGDQVLIFRNVVEASWSAKLEPRWEGPYIVHSIKGTTYRLKRPTTGTILPFTIHRNRLKKYYNGVSSYQSSKSLSTRISN